MLSVAWTQGQCDAQRPNSHSWQPVRQGRCPAGTAPPIPPLLTELVYKCQLAYASTSVNETAG